MGSGSENLQPVLLGGSHESRVDGCDASVIALRCEQDAAVRHPQAGHRSESGQRHGGIDWERELADLEFIESCAGHIEMAGSQRPHENLGEGERVGAELVIRRPEEKLFGGTMVLVARIQIGDEHACVEHDHVGQSWRSSSR